ncbi:hypothetical protein AOQ84DRAFT_31351 [Glonium stellatum]|uniref:HMG box domain-containing protein n=1 Tax=Glonium stellatum TaxID=574774 RepID=A0A8E2F290_9PEZI|nr:hypothetical protein AOQ84DRAFT_31351 [Glonium stellatum]
MNDLGERLERLGLSQYLEVFVAEGFDSWETVLDITESDLNHLNVKLGHRRKLQRAIAETRGQFHERALNLVRGKASSVDESYRSDESASETKPTKKGEASTVAGGSTSTKRKYRRHPKPDEHAPERPPSAYVIFSNQTRENLKGQELSFTEIAKVVGERWQILSADARETCERQANSAKEKYYAELAEYKKTPQYEQYQRYLEEFKAKHAAPQKEGKRSRIETENNASTGNSYEHPERVSNRRVSAGLLESFPLGDQRSGSSPPLNYARPSQPYPSKSTSPATYPFSGVNSPRLAEHYSPMSASPRSATLHRDTSFDFQPSAGSGSVPELTQRQSDPGPTTSHPPYGHSYSSTSTTPPLAYGSQYHNSVELSSRRSFREMSMLPALTRDDTTISSESNGYAISPYQGSLLEVVDAPKSQRVLPQPVPSLGVAPSPLDQRPPPIPPLMGQPQEFRPTSSLAALLRAGELARVADDQGNDKESSP